MSDNSVSLKTLRFEKLSAEHVQAMIVIENEANTAPWSENSFRNEIDHTHGHFLVAILQGEVVGYGGIWLVIDEAHVITIAIHHSLRGKGIGRLLMIELLNYAKEKNILCASLEVRESNTGAIRLYERLGFVQTTVRKNYYPDNRENAVVMWLHDLDQWEEPSR